jgi:hypothetical protein
LKGLGQNQTVLTFLCDDPLAQQRVCGWRELGWGRGCVGGCVDAWVGGRVCGCRVCIDLYLRLRFCSCLCFVFVFCVCVCVCVCVYLVCVCVCVCVCMCMRIKALKKTLSVLTMGTSSHTLLRPLPGAAIGLA